MPQLLSPFDCSQFDPSQTAGSLPVGKHPVVIIASEVKATKAGDGGMVVFTLQITDGPAKGQQGPFRLNLYSQSQQAAEIAHRQLSALCYVTGKFRITNTEDLHNAPFIVDVEMQKGDEAAAKGYTQVARVYDIRGNEPGKTPPPQGFGGQPQQGVGAQPNPQQQPQPNQPAQWGNAPAPQPPAQPPAAGGWSQQPGQQAPAWGQQPGQPPAQQPQGNPGWGSQPPAAPVPQQPAQQPAWGQQPNGAQGGQPSWGAPR